MLCFFLQGGLRLAVPYLKKTLHDDRITRIKGNLGLFDNLGFGHSGGNVPEHIDVRIWKQGKILVEGSLGRGSIVNGKDGSRIKFLYVGIYAQTQVAV